MATNQAGAAPAAADVRATDASARSDAMSGSLARNWGWVLLRGVLAIAAGVLALLLPGPAILALVLVFATYMIADGVVAIISAVRAARRHERWGWFVAEGLAGLAAGVLALLLPIAAIVTFVVIASAWAIVTGAMMLLGVRRLRPDHGRGWMVLGALLSILWGVLLFIFPVAGVYAMTLWFGAYAFVFGVSLILLALKLRRRAGDRALERGGS